MAESYHSQGAQARFPLSHAGGGGGEVQQGHRLGPGRRVERQDGSLAPRVRGRLFRQAHAWQKDRHGTSGHSAGGRRKTESVLSVSSVPDPYGRGGRGVGSQARRQQSAPKV